MNKKISIIKKILIILEYKIKGDRTSYRKLATKYGVSHTMIAKIIKGE